MFSRILNTKDSEDHLAFTQDQQTVYYTRSDKQNSLEFKLYKANLQEGTSGIWINHILVSLNKPNISIETPFINKTGNRLYFSSNMPGGHGGFDLYVSEINIDGTLGTPVNLGRAINTDKDEKYPALSLDNKHLFFSSKGHENMGGYDVFKSTISDNEYGSPTNLGTTLNTPFDEIAYFLIANNIGYVSSNRSGGNGGYDIFTVTNIDATQTLSDNMLDVKSKQKNTTVTIK
ncbi:TolB family protein [Algibacter mikhailovii]|uniref:TolB family protein n=1 Tax=Algibacter mikhailovii TaxID=425498 RepID=UPI0024944FA7|nr:hypothetical protein [Algibacter mikhailovii]